MGMVIRIALTILAIQTPYMVILFVCHRFGMKLLSELLFLWFFTVLVLIIPISKIGLNWIFGREIRTMHEFVRALIAGGAYLPLAVPDQKEEEEELVQLKRDLNNLARVLKESRSRIGQRMTEARRDALKYRELACMDALTKVFNRRAFDMEINARIEASDRTGARFYLLVIDLDDFKRTNDTHGHQAGDLILEFMGKVLRDCTRGDDDFPFRFGGDEFGLILAEQDRGRVLAVAERIHERFQENPYGVKASVGGCVYAGNTSGGGPEKLIRAADEALYAVKMEKKLKTSTGCHSTIIVA
ncbi:MAG: GGDEF domain-containing protein [Deltaproteobacteria bacterium]|nr:GGDEF domain-containing protein [Deltaproteobacteria bacterium]